MHGEAADALKGGTPLLEKLESGVALIRLGAAEERVVTLTEARIRGLRAILEELATSRPKGVIITGAGQEMFTAGADISIIRDVTDPMLGERLAREGQAVFDLIAALPCPTVAAISGPCVGGGCELVLACQHRLITDVKSSTIGLPEVKLGILPGFGGTQRLPRLVGLPRALDIILAGKTLKPRQALQAGLVNEIVPWHGLLARAEAIASGSATIRPVRLKVIDRLLTYTRTGRRIVQRRAEGTIRKETRGFYPAPPAALHSAVLGLDQGLNEGLQHEARELGRLIVTPESKALVRLFFLTEAAKNLGRAGRGAVQHIHGLVIGAGAMGAGIAGALARNECSVILKDTSEASVAHGVEHIRKGLARSRSLSEQERSFVLNRIETTTRESSNIGSVNFAVEAIFEDLELKQKVLSDVARLLSHDSIIASNTSSLSISKIAAALPGPERVVGMHFFNPVEKMPLVEIVRGEKTSDKTIVVIAALAVKLGKFPIVVNDVPGFLVNRVLSPYLTEAAWLIHDGYRVADIDRAATAFGMPMGPVRLLDEVGLDVAAHVADVMVAGYGDRMRGPGYARVLVAAGRKGKKSGCGFYDFLKDEATGVHPDLRRLLEVKQDEIADPDARVITDRLILALINEAVRSLDEGVAGTPGPEAADQVDLGSVMGFGFPPFRGGLLHYADSIGAAVIYARLRELEQSCGSRFSPTAGIKHRAESGRTFRQRL